MTAYSMMEGPPGPEVVIDGRRYLYFGGTSYLGLAGHPEVIEAGCEALRKYGVHSATTRAGFGTLPPVAEVERQAARFFGREEAFYFGSGYMTNHVLISALGADRDVILVEASSHYCLLEAARISQKPVVLFHADKLDELSRILGQYQRPLILSDAVGPATGKLAPVFNYLELLAASGASDPVLVLDDAHGFGVLGENGRGLTEELGLWDTVNSDKILNRVRLAVGGTLAKALGGYGGILAGDREFIARCRSSSHYFDGASAPAAPVAGATAKALEIVLRNPEIRAQLTGNIRSLRNALSNLGLTVPRGNTAHFGITIGDGPNMARIHQALKERGIWVPYMRAYSGIPAEGVLRFAVFATHSEGQLSRLVSELASLV